MVAAPANRTVSDARPRRVILVANFRGLTAARMVFKQVFIFMPVSDCFRDKIEFKRRLRRKRVKCFMPTSACEMIPAIWLGLPPEAGAPGRADGHLLEFAPTRHGCPSG